MNDMPKYDIARARRALRALLANPDDTRQVFEIIAALPGNAAERMLTRFEKTPSGKRMLQERPSLLAILSDRERLEKMPNGSLGRAYLEFVNSENISAQG